MQCLRQSILTLLVLMCTSLFIHAQAETSPIGVALDQRVIDLTHTLDGGTIARLTDQLAALERRKGAQVAVLLVPTTGDASLEDYANQLFRAWKLGRKDVNDGVLLLVAKDDRKVRIEVGYGLESTVTDLLAHRIIEEHITPAFRDGNYAGGVARGVNDLIVLVDGGEPLKVPDPGLPFGAIAVLLAFVIGAVGGVLVVTRRLHWRRALIAAVLLTVGVVALVGGPDWLIYLLVFPSNLLIGGGVFAALWRFRAVFYGALVLLIYVVGVLIVDLCVGIDLIEWAEISPMILLTLFLYWSAVDKIVESRKNDPELFVARVSRLMLIYLAGLVFLLFNPTPPNWLYAVWYTPSIALLVFDYSSGGGSSWSRRGRGSGSSRSSGNRSSGRGGSSGGGGASGSW